MLSSQHLVHRLALVAGLLASSAVARAQATPPSVGTDTSFDVQLFAPSIGIRPFLTIDSAHVSAHKQWGLSLMGSYQNRPFSIYSVSPADMTEKTVDVVNNQLSFEAAAYVGLLDQFQLGIGLPITGWFQGYRYTMTGEARDPVGSGGLGDIRIEGKAKMATFGPGNEFLLSVIPGVTVPTADRDNFLGDKNLTGRFKTVTEYRRQDFRAAFLLGLLFRQPSKAFSAEVGSQIMYGLATDYAVSRDSSVITELTGRHPLTESEGINPAGTKSTSRWWTDANPVEVDLGLRLALPGQVAVTFGVGAGVKRGIGAPKFRAFLGAAWAPDFRDRDSDGIYDAEDRCPNQPEDKDGFKDSDGCPDPDNDGDGLADAQDKCPDEAEDLDGYQDDDGCPELDNDKDGIPDINDPCPNAAEDGKGKRPKDGCPSTGEDTDGDGIPDSRDKCPDEPEDRDGFQDYDGCPDPDNDEDNIPDAFDACPNEAEDADGFEDTDGCPDPDNDKDGILDAADKCPLEPETINGNQDDDGCPDEGQEIVHVADANIDVRERIGFGPAGGKSGLSTGGTAVARMVAQALRGQFEIAKVRIEVWATGVAKEETQDRANAIVKALVGFGIDPGRLRGVGMGSGPMRIDFVIEHKAAPKKADAATFGKP